MIKRILTGFLIVFFQNVFSQNMTENDSIKYPTTIEILEKYKISDYEKFNFTVDSQIQISDIELQLQKMENAYNELGEILKNVKDKELRKPYLILKSNINSKISLAKLTIVAKKSKIAADKSKIAADKSKKQAEVSTEIVESLKKGENQIKKDK